MEDIYCSRHGLKLQWIEDDALVVDGTAWYVDDLIDCFESFKQGSLKAHCIAMFTKELNDCEQLCRVETSPIARGHLRMRRKLLELVQGEREDGLIALRRQMLNDKWSMITKSLRLVRRNPIIFDALMPETESK